MPTITKMPQKEKQPTQTMQDIYRLVYHTVRWRKLRDKYLMMHPLCERCLANDEYNASEEVHHKKPLSRATSETNLKYLGFDWGNLQALCKHCHHEIHKRMK